MAPSIVLMLTLLWFTKVIMGSAELIEVICVMCLLLQTTPDCTLHTVKIKYVQLELQLQLPVALNTSQEFSLFVLRRDIKGTGKYQQHHIKKDSACVSDSHHVMSQFAKNRRTIKSYKTENGFSILKLLLFFQATLQRYRSVLQCDIEIRQKTS